MNLRDWGFMELRDISMVHEGKFMHYYHERMIGNDGRELMIYEMVSRNPKLTPKNISDGLHAANAVSIICHDEHNELVLLNHEYRPSLNAWIYEFPGGLRDEGEEYATTAVRELREETGLELYQVNAVLDPAPTVVGFSDETVATVIGRARGEFSSSDDPREEIEACWYSKSDVVSLMLTHQPMALGTQRYLYAWVLDYLVGHDIILAP